MADITCSWPRLTCPALALRQAAPWRSKLSATSSVGRPTAAGSGLRWPLPLGRRPEPVERAHYRADRGAGDPSVERGGVELGVAQQDLDHPNVDVLLQQVGREAVPERVRR